MSRARNNSLNKNKPFAIIIGLVLLTILLLTLFDAEEQIRDSLAWAGLVENSVDIRSLFNPHHLLYIPINRLIYISFSPVLETFSGIDAGRLHSVIWAVVMVVSMFVLVNNLTKSILLGVLASILLLTSQSVWVYALQPQAYAPAIGSITLLTAILVLGIKDHLNITWMLIISGLLAVCIFYHQALVIICIPMTYFVLASQQREGIKKSTIILFVSGFLVLSSYIAVYTMSNDEWSFAQFIAYLTMYVSIPDPSYFSFSNFSKHGIREFMGSLQDTFVVAPWQLRQETKFVFIFLSGLIIIWNAVQLVRKEETYQVRGYALIMLIGFWLLCIWGNPLDDGWPMISLMPLLLLAFLFISDALKIIHKLNLMRIVIYGSLIGLVASVSARNFTERILPMHLTKGENYDVARKMAETIPGMCITFDPRQAVTQNMSYYFGGRNKDVWDILSYFYFSKNGKLPFTWVNFTFQDVECFAILSRVVSPNFTVSGVDGYEEPEKWWSFITWLLDLRYADNQKIIGHRKIEVIFDQDGNTYYIIRPDTVEYSSLGDLFIYLDNNLSHIPDGLKNPFMNWLHENGHRISLK